MRGSNPGHSGHYAVMTNETRGNKESTFHEQRNHVWLAREYRYPWEFIHYKGPRLSHSIARIRNDEDDIRGAKCVDILHHQKCTIFSRFSVPGSVY